MMHDRNFTASGVAIQLNAARLLDQLCSHLGEHVTITRSAEGAHLETVIGSADIALSPNRLDIKLRCPTASMLFTVRSMVAEHLFELSGGEGLDLRWADGPQTKTIPDFREATLVSARNITPRMRRVTLAVDDTAHFADGGLHLRILIPPAGRAPVWPQAEPNGRIGWPKGDDTLTIRAYTIRTLDLTRRELEIDFVLHEGADVPGASWALNARNGDIVGLIGPGGGGVPQAKRMILAGDETALPAIARIAAAVPAETELRVYLEVADKEEEQTFVTAGALDVTWFHRDGAEAGTTGRLERLLRDIVPAADPSTFVWAACEQAEARAIRNFMKTEIAGDRTGFSIAAYWQRH
jgi:NADPH-dependent ferric siderophore reductase